MSDFIPEDYVSLTDIAKNFGKKIENWKRTNKTKSLHFSLEKQIISTHPLIIVKEGGSNANAGTWAHPLLAEHFTNWCKTASTPKPGYVYLIWAKGTSRIKIGVTHDINKRLKALDAASPYDLELLRNVADVNSLESELELHTLLAQYRVKGEWFLIKRAEALEIFDSYFLNLNIFT